MDLDLEIPLGPRVDAQGDTPPAKAEQPASEQGAAFATLVAVDGRLLRIDPQPGGGVLLTIERHKPLVLDRFQAAAFRQATTALDASNA